MGADGVLDGPVGEVGRVRAQAGAAGLLAGEFPVAAVPHRALCAACPGRAGLCSHPPELTDRPVEEAVGAQ